MRLLKLIIILLYFLSCNNTKRNIEEHYKHGGIKFKYSLENGKKNGEYIEYYENGTIKEKGVYKDDKKMAPFLTYYANGQLKSEISEMVLDTAFSVEYIEGEKSIIENQNEYLIGKSYSDKGKLKTQLIRNNDSIFIFNYDTLNSKIISIDTIFLKQNKSYKW